MIEKKNFLGSGWRFPPRLDTRGRIELADGERDIREAIAMILLTRKGERPMRPTFGSDLYNLMFAPTNPTTLGLAQVYVRQALAQWEPRITVKDVLAKYDADDPSRLMISINYQSVDTNTKYNLVFPFYTIPGER